MFSFLKEKLIDVEVSRDEPITMYYPIFFILGNKNNDILYVSINSLHKISKYVGKEGKAPKLNKIGSDAWKTLKRKTKRKVKDIAQELIKLYAKRKASQGFAFNEDGYLQNELEASFIYEDTPDQLKATNDVKADMQKANLAACICADSQ